MRGRTLRLVTGLFAKVAARTTERRTENSSNTHLKVRSEQQKIQERVHDQNEFRMQLIEPPGMNQLPVLELEPTSVCPPPSSDPTPWC